MTQRFTEVDYNTSRSRDYLPLTCERCGKPFQLMKYIVMKVLKGQVKDGGKYCSRACGNDGLVAQRVSCGQCDNSFKMFPKDIARSQSGKVFCSNSCAALFNNNLYK